MEKLFRFARASRRREVAATYDHHSIYSTRPDVKPNYLVIGTYRDGQIYSAHQGVRPDFLVIGTYGNGTIHFHRGGSKSSSSLAGSYGNGEVRDKHGNVIAEYDLNDEGAAAAAFVAIINDDSQDRATDEWQMQ